MMQHHLSSDQEACKDQLTNLYHHEAGGARNKDVSGAEVALTKKKYWAEWGNATLQAIMIKHLA